MEGIWDPPWSLECLEIAQLLQLCPLILTLQCHWMQPGGCQSTGLSCPQLVTTTHNPAFGMHTSFPWLPTYHRFPLILINTLTQFAQRRSQQSRWKQHDQWYGRKARDDEVAAANRRKEYFMLSNAAKRTKSESETALGWQYGVKHAWAWMISA